MLVGFSSHKIIDVFSRPFFCSWLVYTLRHAAAITSLLGRPDTSKLHLHLTVYTYKCAVKSLTASNLRNNQCHVPTQTICQTRCVRNAEKHEMTDMHAEHAYNTNPDEKSKNIWHQWHHQDELKSSTELRSKRREIQFILLRLCMCFLYRSIRDLVYRCMLPITNVFHTDKFLTHDLE